MRSEPSIFWLSSTHRESKSDGLKGFLLEFLVLYVNRQFLWVEKCIGDAAAQNGAKIGNDKLSLSTVDGFISTEFYGTNIGGYI